MKKMNKKVFKVVEEVLNNSYYSGEGLNLKWYNILNSLSNKGIIDYYIFRYFITKSYSLSWCEVYKNSPTKKIKHKLYYSH